MPAERPDKILAKRVTDGMGQAMTRTFAVLLHRIQIGHQVRHLLRIVETRPGYLGLPHAREHLRSVLPQRRNDGDF